MKKWTAILLSLLLLLTAGCAGKEPEVITEATTQPETLPVETTTAPPETTEPAETTPPLPRTEEAAILADRVPAVLMLLSRGDTVDVVGEYDEDHYVIKTDSGYGLVEKYLLAMPGDAAYEAWTGYSYWNRSVYENYHLTGTPIEALKTNEKVEVLDELDDCFVVKVGDVTGFMKREDISKNPVRSQNSDNGGSSSGSSNSGGQDGGDISLQWNGGITLLSAITQEGTVTGQATVKADGTEVILGYFSRSDTAQIVMEAGFAEDWEGYATVLMDSLYAHVPEVLIQRKGEEAYAQWDGYAKYKTVLYDNFYLRGEGKTLGTNTAVHVVADLESSYLVTVDDAFGYVAKDMVSKTRIVIGGAPSDSGSSGTKEWSDPVL